VATHSPLKSMGVSATAANGKAASRQNERTTRIRMSTMVIRSIINARLRPAPTSDGEKRGNQT